MTNSVTPAKLRPGKMRVFTGSSIRPGDPIVNINDVAHSLSGQFRFGGHAPVRMTVAEHSIDVANMAADLWMRRQLQRPGGPLPSKGSFDEGYRLGYLKVKLEGLLHDAHEYIWMDVPSPVKGVIEQYLPEYQTLEDDLQAKVMGQFGIEMPLHEEVHEADAACGQQEYQDLWQRTRTTLAPDEAEVAFLRMFYQIIHEISLLETGSAW